MEMETGKLVNKVTLVIAGMMDIHPVGTTGVIITGKMPMVTALVIHHILFQAGKTRTDTP